MKIAKEAGMVLKNKTGLLSLTKTKTKQKHFCYLETKIDWNKTKYKKCNLFYFS